MIPIRSLNVFIHNTDEKLHSSVDAEILRVGRPDGISHMPVRFPIINQSTAVNIHAYWLVATGTLADGPTYVQTYVYQHPKSPKGALGKGN